MVWEGEGRVMYSGCSIRRISSWTNPWRLSDVPELGLLRRAFDGQIRLLVSARVGRGREVLTRDNGLFTAIYHFRTLNA